MKKTDIQNALSGIDDKYLDRSLDFQDLSSQFKREKNKKLRSVCAVCCCMILCLSAFGIARSGLLNGKVSVEPEESTTDNLLNAITSPVLNTNSQVETERYSGNLPPTDAPTDAVIPPVVTDQPKPVVEMTGSVTAPNSGKSDEIVIDSEYVTYITDGPYASYQGGKVIDESKVGEKIGDTAVTAGWDKGADGTIEKPETLRAEIYAIKSISPDVAVCIKFIDKGEAITTDHYYLRYNPDADLSDIKDYLIPKQDIIPTDADGCVPE